MFYNVLRVWFDAKIKKKMDRKKTKLEVNEVFPIWKKASIKLYTMLAQVFNFPNYFISKYPLIFLCICSVLGQFLGLLFWYYFL